MDQLWSMDKIFDAVRQVVEQKIKPALASHGGDIELVDVKDGVVKVRLRGACLGCPMAGLTLKNGVEKDLKAAVPQIKKVETA